MVTSEIGPLLSQPQPANMLTQPGNFVDTLPQGVLDAPIVTDFAMAVPFKYRSEQVNSGSIAAIVHIFYPDIADELCQYISNLRQSSAVFVQLRASRIRLGENSGPETASDPGRYR